MTMPVGFFNKIYTAIAIIAVFVLFFQPSFAHEELFCDEIFFEGNFLELNLNNNLPSPFKQKKNKEETGLEFQKGNVFLFSNSRKELNDYMVDDYKSNTGAELNLNRQIFLSGGMEIKHQNPNAAINSKTLYLNPSFRFNDDFSITFANKFDNDSKINKHDFGIKYSPKLFKNANFGVSTGGVWDEESLKSRNLKFSSDLFLF